MVVWVRQEGKLLTSKVNIGWEGRLYRPFDPVFSAFDPDDEKAVQARKGLKAALGTDKVAFIRRYPLTPNHYYTEHINSEFRPGGGICILDLNDGSVKEFDMRRPGVVNRFDVSYDAKKIVFDFKDDHMEGYRIYELTVATGAIRQLTFPPEDEDELQALYKVRTLWDTNWEEYHHGEFNDYHHGTDDMHPCYLPDGGIAFVSTRCKISTICDGPDIFTTTNMYRMDADGGNLRRLSKDMVSVFCPVVMPSGEILYHRWEYVDKGATISKCLWSMYPDGSHSREIYGNDILTPHTIIQGRPIPGTSDKYVALGAYHMDNAIGNVMKIDTSKNIRTDACKTNLTPECPWPVWGIDDAFAKPVYPGPGWNAFFRDPYPVSEELFMVAYKPKGPHWTDENVWGLYVLKDNGQKQLFHKEDETSCWQPMPLKVRVVPPVPTSSYDRTLAAEGKAQCIVVNIYHGMENTAPDTIKYLRIMEQVPRSWAARRHSSPHAAEYDTWGQQHAVVSNRTHLWVAAQWGIATVESDGSANFTVPANRAIYFQALDAEFRTIQSERTYVNYMPGEQRSCIGCHETPDNAAPVTDPPLALLRAAEDPCKNAQPGESTGKIVLSYPDIIQPIWDKHCISCHGSNGAGDLNLKGTQTTHFSVSYEALLSRPKEPENDDNLLGLLIDELGTDTRYRQAHTLFGNRSVLLKMLGLNVWNLTPSQKNGAAALASSCSPNLTTSEKAKVARWVDNNCQYYGSYWGRRNLRFKNHPNFRIAVAFDEAVSESSPTPEGQR
ncbi:MAG: HzsA-related protein [Planctomycetota bacterium]